MEKEVTDWIIETGIPVPPAKSQAAEQRDRGKASPIGKAIKGLEVGQSLFTDQYPRDTIRRMVDSRQRRNPEKYVTREVDSGIRVWRVG